MIVPVYNGERTIAAALASIAAQTRPATEIVVVDDGSTDGTAAVVERSARTSPVPLRYVRQANQKQAAARNHGVALATGTYVAFLDADDAWLPQKLAVTLAAFEREPDLAAVIGNYEIAEGGRTRRFVPDVLPAPPSAAQDLLEGNFCWLPAVVVRRDAFQALGGFDPAFESAEDVEFGFRLCKQYRFAVLPEVVARYQRTPFSSTYQEARELRSLRRLYDTLLARPDLTAAERQLVLAKQAFWAQRERLFAVRWTAVRHGQLAGLGAFGRYLWPRHLSARAIGLLSLLLVPGSFRFLRATRWRSFDFSGPAPEPRV